MWVSACYTKTTKEIQRSRREREHGARTKDASIDRPPPPPPQRERPTDTSSSSSPPFPIIICPKPHSTFFRRRRAFRAPPRALASHPTSDDTRPTREDAFFPSRSTPIRRPASLASTRPAPFPSSANANASHAVVGNSENANTISRRKNRESRASTRDLAVAARRRAKKRTTKKHGEKKRTTTFGRTWNGMVDAFYEICALLYNVWSCTR